MIKKLRITLKKLVKLTVFFLIIVKNKIMIILDMPHLKMAVADKVASEVSVEQIFQIFLKISLETLVVIETKVEEVQIIEVLT